MSGWTLERESAVLAGFSRLVLKHVIEQEGERFYCDLCSPKRAVRRHESYCPILDVLHVLDRMEGRRIENLPPPLESFIDPADDPLPLSSDGSHQPLGK